MTSNFLEKLDLSSHNRPIITFWSDRSEEAVRLENQLWARGYNIKGALTGSFEPIIKYSGCFYSGFRRIEAEFLQ
jgi:hypothetical protein